MALAQFAGEGKDQSTNIREFTTNAVTEAIIAAIRQGYSRAILKAFGFRFPQSGGLAPTLGGGRELGMSAGDEATDISTWVNAGYRDYHSEAAGVNSKSNIYTGLAGMDFVVTEQFVFGASAGYSTSKSRSSFTSTTLVDFNSVSTVDNWTFAGYGAMLVTDNFFVDGTAGVTFSQSRVNSLSSTNIVTVSGDQDADIKFLSLNFNYAQSFDKIAVLGTVGYNYSLNRADAFTSDQGTAIAGSVRANSSLSLGGEVGYQFKRYAPYVLGAVEIDLARNPRGGGDFLVGTPVAETEETGLRVGAGVDFQYTDSIVGSFEVSKVFGKEGVVDTSGFLNVHITF